MPEQILFICHRIPYPPNKGDKIRSFNFIRHLAENNDIHLAFLIDDRHDLENVEPLRAYAKNIFFEKISPKVKKLTGFINAILTSRPISIPYFYSESLQKKIDLFLDDNRIDKIFCFSSPTAEYLYRSRHAATSLKRLPRIMDLIDVDSHKWRQYSENNTQPLRWLYRRESHYLLEYEKKITENFNSTLLVSESEKKLFCSYSSATNVQVIGNGVDIEHFSPRQRQSPPNPLTTLTFVGAMDYWPNVDGVMWFARSIFPQLRKMVPNLCFQIVGRNPSAELSSLKEIEGISIIGAVTDIREYIASADICVIPLRIARGIQNKVLEAMAMGKPVVCSSQALEGIDAEPGKDLLTADDASTFVQATLKILNDALLRRNLGVNARNCMEKKYTWKTKLHDLDILLTNVQERQ